MPIDPTIPPSLTLENREAERVANLERRVRELERISTFAPPPWRNVGDAGEPAFVNNFSHYNATTYPKVGFRKMPWGNVELKGLMGHTTWSLGAVPGTLAFTLPTGYRPPKYEHLNAMATDAQASVRIETDGEVYIYVTVGGWFTLSGLFFSTTE